MIFMSLIPYFKVKEVFQKNVDIWNIREIGMKKISQIPKTYLYGEITKLPYTQEIITGNLNN
jgi:hypothetical protein